MRAKLSHLNRLMGCERAHMAFLDPPYNVRVRDIGGRGRVKHQEFAMASGEMSRAAFTSFPHRYAHAGGAAFRSTAPCILSAWTGATSAN